MKYFLGAFNLLTVLPLPAPKDWQTGDSGRSAGWYSFVGLSISLLVAGSLFVFHIFFPNTVSAALSLAIWVVLTGGLHLDGLADCFDGMFHASDAEHRLQIMRDPHIGAFGVIGLVLILLVKFSLLSSMSPDSFPLAILLSASFARWCILLAGKQSLARSDGMAADFASGLQTQSIVLGALIPLGLVIWLREIGLLAAGFGLLTTFIILGIAKKNLGGVTGDVFGMIVELVETGMLLVFTITSQQAI